jgi:hypothetical protein
MKTAKAQERECENTNKLMSPATFSAVFDGASKTVFLLLGTFEV